MSKEIIAAILIIVQRWTNIISQRVQAKWGNMAGIPGESHIETNTAATGSMILGTIFAGGMKAYIAEEGSGSLLDRNNPDLQSYVSSEFFNPLRSSTDFKITGRAKGTYKDIDGVSHTSSGRMAGIPIESSRADSDFRAFQPQHTIQTEINNAVIEIETEIAEAVCDIILDTMVAKFPKSIKI